MTQSRWRLLLVALICIVGLTAGSALRGPSAPAGRGRTANSTFQKISFPAQGGPGAVATPEAVRDSPAQPAVNPVVQDKAAPAHITIEIQPGADDESQILKAVYQKVNPAVVQVVNLAQVTNQFSGHLGLLPQSEGSGFLWDSLGHIITNDHVIDGADQLQVVLSDGTEMDAKLVGTDPGSDIAVIQVDAGLIGDLVPVEPGDTMQVRVGDMAIALGNPFGLQNTMTRGIVSAVGRSIPSQTQYSIPAAIQTDAAINPGNSGGPLLNVTGQVIGVNDQIESRTGTSSGVGFAIPIDLAERVVPALIKDGQYQHAYLGITADTFSRTWAQALGLPAASKGVYVMDATLGGPAADAGLRGGMRDTSIMLSASRHRAQFLQSGGDLITAIDGHAVVKMDDLLLYLDRQGAPGQKVELTVVRASKTLTVTATLGVRPDQSTLLLQGNGEPQA